MFQTKKLYFQDLHLNQHHVFLIYKTNMLLNDWVTGSNQDFCMLGCILSALLICEPYRGAIHANETPTISLRIIQLPASGNATCSSSHETWSRQSYQQTRRKQTKWFLTLKEEYNGTLIYDKDSSHISDLEKAILFHIQQVTPWWPPCVDSQSWVDYLLIVLNDLQPLIM